MDVVEEKLCLDARKRLSMTCVDSVDSYSEQILKLTVHNNRVTICGTKLKITAYNKATGTLLVDGEFSEIKYGGQKMSFVKRIFK